MTNAVPQAAALAVEEAPVRYPLDDFLADISGIAATIELIDLKRRSRDHFWYSSILNEMLKDKVHRSPERLCEVMAGFEAKMRSFVPPAH